MGTVLPSPIPLEEAVPAARALTEPEAVARKRRKICPAGSLLLRSMDKSQSQDYS